MKDSSGKNSILPEPFTADIGIGDYIDVKFDEHCGIASADGMIMECLPKNAFTRERYNAQPIWSKGASYVTYALPNSYTANGKIAEINFSLEICSKATGYNRSYPSDITFWINEKELCTYTSPGDFGNRYGKFTHDWWYAESTKYGLMTTVAVRDDGVYLNEKCVNKSVTVEKLELDGGDRTTLKIGVKKNAENIGGFNIFGEKFGDYAQPIRFNAVYSRIKK